jgi:hypothetical protein
MCALVILKHIKYRASVKADSAHMIGNKLIAEMMSNSYIFIK